MTDTQYAVISWTGIFLVFVLLTVFTVLSYAYLWAFLQVAIIFVELMALGGSGG